VRCLALIALTLFLCIPADIRAQGHAQAQARKVDALDLTLRDVLRGRDVPLAKAAHRLAEANVVLVGESHDDPDHHAAQLQIINSLRLSGYPVAVGLEMFQHREQQILDDWVVGNLSESDMAKAFARNWDASWPLYSPIFEYCRQERIPMIGLNVPREITRQVARQGFSSLSREQIGQLPPVVCIVDPAYEAFLRRVLGTHAGDGEFNKFCEAQLVWDTAMAYYAGEYHVSDPERTLVVLTGSVHAWKPAVPAQLRKLHPELSSLSVLPAESGVEPGRITSKDADYLYMRGG
jgi:uncharacterized iron-regulated protein